MEVPSPTLKLFFIKNKVIIRVFCKLNIFHLLFSKLVLGTTTKSGITNFLDTGH